MDFAPTLSDQINAAIDAGLQAENAKQPKRTYLGASEIGEECERRLAYSYHDFPREAFPGRALRRFRLGHIHEDETVAWLRNAGFTIEGQQAGYGWAHREDGSPRHSGHIDGVVTAGPLPLPYPVLFEHKVAKSNIWRAMMAHGIKKENPRYYAQMQIYMRQFSLGNALFVALNTDTSELHFEVVPYDSVEAEKLVDKVQRIVTSKGPLELPRAAQVSTDFKCKWCPYAAECWAPPKAAMPKPMWMR